MAIILVLGNIGSGKTLTIVREMVRNDQGLKFYTNITPAKPRLTPHIKKINASMIVLKELKATKKKRDGTEEPVYEFKLNKEFWKSIDEPITIVLDEVHTMFDARRGFSKVNNIFGDFLAMLRRVIGEDPMVQGDLILITQLSRRVDVIGRDMVHQVRYHICHYTKQCQRCFARWHETSEVPEPVKVCPVCGHNRLKKTHLSIEVKHFAGMTAYDGWKEWGMNTWHRHYFVNDVEGYFKYYSTTQWEDMFSELYD